MSHFIGMITSALLTLLGLRTIFDARQVNPDEEVAFHGAYLYWNADGTLTLVLRGRLFEPEKEGAIRRAAINRIISPALFRYMGKKPSDFPESALDLMYERLAPFLADGESGERLKVRVVGRGGAATLTLPETSSGGYFSITTSTVANRSIAELAAQGPQLVLEVLVPEEDKRQFVARLPVPPRQIPLLVVSDVDDTVRIAEITNRPLMIERVFLRGYEEVPGMSGVYDRLASRGARFHFVSGSPWQIAPVIADFLAGAKFPPAVLHCRQIGWDFWNSDPLETREYKVRTIQTLLAQFPSCPVLLVGDDGEHDPEVYSEICRDHAKRVVGVWIRRVRPEWDPARLAGASGLLGKDRVLAFQSAAALDRSLMELPVEGIDKR